MGKIFYIMGKSSSGKDHIYGSWSTSGTGTEAACDLYNPSHP